MSLVNKAVVDYYFVELSLEKHFEALRHFLLMEDGEFAQSLSDLLFEKVPAGVQTRLWAHSCAGSLGRDPRILLLGGNQYQASPWAQPRTGSSSVALSPRGWMV